MSQTPTSQTRTVRFGPVARFRTLDGDLAIIRGAAEKRGQTLSAYLRDAAMTNALEDLGCGTRTEAARKLARRTPGAKDV